LAGFTATLHVDLDVKRLAVLGQQQRLFGDHDGCLTTEVLGDVFAIDLDVA
jgi:hypothetical protein